MLMRFLLRKLALIRARLNPTIVHNLTGNLKAEKLLNKHLRVKHQAHSIKPLSPPRMSLGANLDYFGLSTRTCKGHKPSYNAQNGIGMPIIVGG